MRLLRACTTVLLFVPALAATSRADSTEYAVTINVYWRYSAFYGAFGLSEPGNPVVDEFFASYDMNASGNVIPGTMTFSVVDNGGPLAGATPFTFGVVPSFCNQGAGTLAGEGCVPFPNAPAGSYYPGGGLAWYDSDGFLIEAGATPGDVGTFTGTSAVINCVYQACTDELLSCYDILCAGGGNNPASGGFVIESIMPITTPEPSSAMLLGCGLVIGLVVRRRHAWRFCRAVYLRSD
ncbi:MAG TPA: PEP-CTERM sorting domain-containing protein [Candidatus Cybelea sp.]|nr:PEP-CTERM sorting domain-containing protein [Candidatus Cybelea sp.]